jgi:hypothetical protein
LTSTLAALLSILVNTALLLSPAEAEVQDGEKLAQSLRGNVIRIVAEGTDGGRPWRQDGFGFIVGEREDRVLVVTANHVARSQGGPSSRPKDIRGTFFHDQGRTHPLELLQLHDDQYDLAVLEVRPPTGSRWVRQALASNTALRGQHVWYIGRDRQWYIPTLSGRINGITLDFRILVDGLNLQVGTSGAPLITDSGIVGMLVDDAPGNSTRAISIEIVRRAFELWNLPWGLTSTTTTTTLPPSQTVLPTQDLRDFRVSIEKISVGSGFSPDVTFLLRYTNKTQQPLVLGLCKSRHELKTLAFDEQNVRYLLERSIGIADVCFDPGEPTLILPPEGSSRVTFLFKPASNKVEAPTTFTLTSEHVICSQDAAGKCRIKSKHGLTFMDLRGH